MSKAEHFDAIVIGAGQGGVPLARAFAEKVKRTAIIERSAVGGTCINYGCTPTKTLVHIAKVAQMTRRAQEYGVGPCDPVVDMLRARNLKRAIVEDFRSSGEASLEQTKGLELIYGHATFTGRRILEVRLRTGGSRSLSADTVVINVGARPFIPPIEGLDKTPYLDNRSIMELDHVPESLIILGGGYIGVEFSQMFARFGCKVTVVEQGNRFLPHEDEDVAKEIFKILSDEGVEILTGAKAQKVACAKGEMTVSITMSKGKRSLKGSELLVAVGRQPNTDDLNLGVAGVDLDARGYVSVDSKLRTSAKGIYAIGDANGGPAFTHISYDDYRIVAANLLEGGKRTTKKRNVPYCMFIDPELGRVGLSEDEAKKKGIDYRLCKLSMTHVARALEMNETLGFVKALVSKKTDRILGAAVLGVEGGEIMSMIELAMMGGLTAKQLNNGVFAHPTLSELLNNLFG